MVPLLAGYAVVSFMSETGKTNPKPQKLLLYSLIGAGALLIVSVVAKGVFLAIYEACSAGDACSKIWQQRRRCVYHH